LSDIAGNPQTTRVIKPSSLFNIILYLPDLIPDAPRPVTAQLL
ncbi:unnamed protein product, partial [marine sediment metagenome]